MIDHNNLEEFSDLVNHDMEDRSGTGIKFYAALAHETGGPVLEIACGTGRVSIPIARLGFAVTGLDIVPGMLEQARGRSGAHLRLRPCRLFHAVRRAGEGAFAGSAGG